MAEIILKRGEVAFCDDEDYDKLSQRKWYRLNQGYAVSSFKKEDGKWGLLLMHRFISDCPKGHDIDHINRNKLDNRKENLRIATRSQNIVNRPAIKSNTSGFKGVYFNKKWGKWIAGVHHHNKRHAIGGFSTKEEAAIAYDAEAKRIWGDFAYLNFPDLA